MIHSVTASSTDAFFNYSINFVTCNEECKHVSLKCHGTFLREKRKLEKECVVPFGPRTLMELFRDGLQLFPEKYERIARECVISSNDLSNGVCCLESSYWNSVTYFCSFRRRRPRLFRPGRESPRGEFASKDPGGKGVRSSSRTCLRLRQCEHPG